MPGFGSQPYGSSPYGLGTPATAPAQGGRVLRNTSTGGSTGSRKINPATKDYELDDFGRIVGMPNVHQLVFLAVSTTRGSSAMRELGQSLRLIDRITPNFQRRVDTELRSAVQHLVDRDLIAVIDTQVQVVREGVVFARLRWQDLNTGLVEETSVGGSG